MPWRPDFAAHRRDGQFEPYRNRVGRLFRDEEEVGLVLVKVEPYSEQASGWLWWRRWTPSRDALWLWTIVNGQFSDHWVTDALDDELEAFGEGCFSYYGEELRVRWTDQEASAQLRAEAFER